MFCVYVCTDKHVHIVPESGAQPRSQHRWKSWWICCTVFMAFLFCPWHNVDNNAGQTENLTVLTLPGMRRSYSPGVRQTYSTHKMDFLMEFENLIYGGLLEDVLPQNSGSELATPAEAGVCNSSNSLPTQYGNYCVEEGGVLSHRYPGCPKAEASFLKILCDKPVKETQARCTTQKNTTCRKCVLGWGGFFAYLILERAPAL